MRVVSIIVLVCIIGQLAAQPAALQDATSQQPQETGPPQAGQVSAEPAPIEKWSEARSYNEGYKAGNKVFSSEIVSAGLGVMLLGPIFGLVFSPFGVASIEPSKIPEAADVATCQFGYKEGRKARNKMNRGIMSFIIIGIALIPTFE